LGSGGSDDDLGAHRRNPNLDTRITVLHQLTRVRISCSSTKNTPSATNYTVMPFKYSIHRKYQ